MFLHFFARYFPAGVEGIGLPNLKFVTQADKSDLGGKARVRAELFRNDDAAVPVEPEILDRPVERDREFVPLVRIVRQAAEKPVDFLRKPLPAAIEGRSVERGVAIDGGASSSTIAVALKHGAERGWYRDAAFGVDLVCECRDKAVHPLFAFNASFQLSTQQVIL
jgi:hypothetical protein